VGTATITVLLHDDGGTFGGGVDTSDPEMFVITLSPVNDPPVAVDDDYSTSEDVPLTVPAEGVLGNDSDIDGDSLTAMLVADASNGSVTLNADGSFTYTPSAGFSGSDSFTYQAHDGQLDSNEATVRIQVDMTSQPGGGRLFVVDSSSRRTFEYDTDGNSLQSGGLYKKDVRPRGIASTADGTTLWVVDRSGKVFVYDGDHRLLGSWEIDEVDKPEGITVHGDDLWIVDLKKSLVYDFQGGALRRGGHAEPSSEFQLDIGNRRPTDLVTDGSHLWVVDDARGIDQVFRYSVGGELEGSWRIDAANGRPTGLTIDPNDADDIWIVDSRRNSVYQYDGAAARTDGMQTASGVFQLDSTNRKPQGIALAPTSLTDPSSIGAGTRGGPLKPQGSSKADAASHGTEPKSASGGQAHAAAFPLEAPRIANLFRPDAAKDASAWDVGARPRIAGVDGGIDRVNGLAAIERLHSTPVFSREASFDEAIVQLTEEDGLLGLPAFLNAFVAGLER
jgi:Bacterial Ig domain